jgi:hypothetical protein
MLEQQEREAEAEAQQERRRADAHPDDLEEEEVQQVGRGHGRLARLPTQLPRGCTRSLPPCPSRDVPMQARAWDEFKDDNPRGWGNSKLRPCG